MIYILIDFEIHNQKKHSKYRQFLIIINDTQIILFDRLKAT